MTQPEQPVEARCDHCKQTRPLFLYEPDHNMHAIPVACEWCDREKQPLLCTRCWGVEREREESAPMSADEDEATAFLIRAAANNGRLIAEHRDQVLADHLPPWEAVYESATVTPHLIAYCSDEVAARGAAEAWLRAHCDDVAGLVWTPDPQMEWLSLSRTHEDGTPLDTEIVVRRRATRTTSPSA